VRDDELINHLESIRRTQSASICLNLPLSIKAGKGHHPDRLAAHWVLGQQLPEDRCALSRTTYIEDQVYTLLTGINMRRWRNFQFISGPRALVFAFYRRTYKKSRRGRHKSRHWEYHALLHTTLHTTATATHESRHLSRDSELTKTQTVINSWTVR